MEMTIAKKACNYSLYGLVLAVMLFQFPAIGVGEEYTLGVDVSPKIINIASERNGEIRIATNMRYAFFIDNDGQAFVYFNDSDSVENIRATRDSLGNLILKFDLNDLLKVEDYLEPDADNLVNVVVTASGIDYSGEDFVFIVNKKAAERNPRSRTQKFR